VECLLNLEARCQKCGGQKRQGEVFIRVKTSGVGQSFSPMGFPSTPGMGIPGGQTTTEERPLWREQTGEKKGWLLKRDETKTMKISGFRCTVCGYLELYAHE
jgi:hypothetical protein